MILEGNEGKRLGPILPKKKGSCSTYQSDFLTNVSRDRERSLGGVLAHEGLYTP